MYNVIFSIEDNKGQKEYLVKNKIPNKKKNKLLENALSSFYRQNVKIICEK